METVTASPVKKRVFNYKHLHNMKKETDFIIETVNTDHGLELGSVLGSLRFHEI